jgi:hypothetical protein
MVEKRLNKTAKNGIFIWKGKKPPFSHLNVAIHEGTV